MNRKGLAPIFVLATVLVIIIVGIVLLFGAHKNRSPAGVACTTEAKECPDGSYVGRTGPSCAFAACPVTPSQPSSTTTSSTIDTSAWKIYTNQQYGFAVRYPSFISPNDIMADQPDDAVIFTNGDGNPLYSFTIYSKSATTSLVEWFVQTYDPQNLLLPSGAEKVVTLNGTIQAIQAQNNVPIPEKFSDGLEGDALGMDDIYMMSSDGKSVVGLDFNGQVPWWYYSGYGDLPYPLENAILSTFQFIQPNASSSQ